MKRPFIVSLVCIIGIPLQCMTLFFGLAGWLEIPSALMLLFAISQGVVLFALLELAGMKKRGLELLIPGLAVSFAVSMLIDEEPAYAFLLIQVIAVVLLCSKYNLMGNPSLLGNSQYEKR